MTRDRKLTSEDRILWTKVARTAHPLPGRMETLLASTTPLRNPAGAGEPMSTSSPSPAAIKTAASRQASARAGLQTPTLSPIERPVHRRLAKGRLPIDARLDLHGLFQDEAHDLLLTFLVRAHARGLRHVLVITGKGTSQGSEGVLRRAVPQWLVTPEFRSLVSGCEEAARGHGGEGAVYVRLRREGSGGR